MRIKRLRIWKVSLVAVSVMAIVIFLLFNLYTFFFQKHQINELLVLEAGSTTSDLLRTLDKQDVSIDFYEARLWQRISNYQIKAGTYAFNQPLRLSTLLSNLNQGVGLVSGLQLVIPEGFNNRKVLERLKATVEENNLEKFDLDLFARLIQSREGKLFPSTYFLTSDSTAESLLAQITTKYQQELSVFKPAITNDELIMASIIEREVITDTDRRMVADILQRRLAEGKRLQVDATLDYYLDKSSDEIYLSELQTDHPYNTYRRGGLPPTPISNPGIKSLQAVRNPIKNNYYFYLSAPDQTTYFAINLEEHIENRKLYLE